MSERKVPLGAKPVDDLLGGGIEKGIVTQFHGDAGSGKTNICILLALACASEGNVAYLDTENGLSLERVKQICSAKYPESKILKNILVKRVENFSEQSKIVQKLEKMELRAVIVDSIVMLYRLELSDKTAKSVNLKLVEQIRTLSSIAEKNDLPVLVTNQVYHAHENGKLFKLKEKVGTAAGDILKYWPKSIISIEKMERANVRKATIVKHRSLPEGRSCLFEITGKGIEEVSGSGEQLF